MLRSLAVRALTADAGRWVSSTASALQQQSKGKPSPSAAKATPPPPAGKGSPPPPPAAKGPNPPPPSGPGASQDDVVLRAFKEQMRHFRGMAEGLQANCVEVMHSVGQVLQPAYKSSFSLMPLAIAASFLTPPFELQKIPVPWELDAQGITKYITEVEALKQKVGAPSLPQHLEAEMRYLFDSVGHNWRKFHKLVFSIYPPADKHKPALAAFERAIDEIEAKTGKPLDHSNPEGQKMLVPHHETMLQAVGWKDDGSSVKKMVFEEYSIKLRAMKEDLIGQMEDVKAKLGIPNYKIDLEAIQKKIMAKAK